MITSLGSGQQDPAISPEISDWKAELTAKDTERHRVDCLTEILDCVLMRCTTKQSERVEAAARRGWKVCKNYYKTLYLPPNTEPINFQTTSMQLHWKFCQHNVDWKAVGSFKDHLGPKVCVKNKEVHSAATLSDGESSVEGLKQQNPDN